MKYIEEIIKKYEVVIKMRDWWDDCDDDEYDKWISEHPDWSKRKCIKCGRDISNQPAHHYLCTACYWKK